LLRSVEMAKLHDRINMVQEERAADMKRREEMATRSEYRLRKGGEGVKKKSADAAGEARRSYRKFLRASRY